MVRKVPVRPTPAEQCTSTGVEGEGESARVARVNARRCDGESGTPEFVRGARQLAQNGHERARGYVPWSPQ